MKHSFLLLAALAAACTIDDGDAPATTVATGELGGANAVLAATGEHEAVVNIGNCSGTLISQDTVITAGHCVCGSSGTYPPVNCQTRKTVRFSNVLPIGGTVRQDVTVGADVLVYPDFNNGGWLANDYALLHLDTRADQLVKVAPVRLSSALPATGETHTLVGYGGASDPCNGTFGTKRRGNSVLDEVFVYSGVGGRSLRYLDTALFVCPGDSGGAAISTATRQLVGVCSTGDNSITSNYDATSEAWGWLRAHACTAADAVATAATCREGPALVTAYRDPSFAGISQQFATGRWPSVDLGQIGNDTISSLRVFPGAFARLWAEGSCWGDTFSYGPSNVSNVAATLNNRTSCIDVTPAVTLYQSQSYTGDEQTFPIGGYNHHIMPIVGDNNAESVVVAPGLVARLCSVSGAPGSVGSGTCVDVAGSLATLGSLNNAVSNVEVAPAVTVYRSANYGGIAQTFRPGDHGSASFTTIGNDTISSLVVGPGLQARLCSENGGWGNCQTYTGAVSAVTPIIDNNTSNIEITAIP